MGHGRGGRCPAAGGARGEANYKGPQAGGGVGARTWQCSRLGESRNGAALTAQSRPRPARREPARMPAGPLPSAGHQFRSRGAVPPRPKAAPATRRPGRRPATRRAVPAGAGSGRGCGHAFAPSAHRSRRTAGELGVGHADRVGSTENSRHGTPQRHEYSWTGKNSPLFSSRSSIPKQFQDVTIRIFMFPDCVRNGAARSQRLRRFSTERVTGACGPATRRRWRSAGEGRPA